MLLDKRYPLSRLPIHRASTDVESEIREDLAPELGVNDLGVKLDAEEPSALIRDRGDRASLGRTNQLKAGR
jgi:hypothetical protein